MPGVVTTCRLCGQEFEPDRDAIVAGVWHTCPACRPQPVEENRCERCSRVLRAGNRSLCLSCAMGGSLL